MTTTAQALGTPVVRLDGREKVTGNACYAYEYPTRGVTYVWPVQSTIARGRVTGIDATAALAVPGVLAVLTPGNVARLRLVAFPMLAGEELLVLQSEEVAYHGQIVAAVVATSPETAQEAAAGVAVSYHPEPHDVLLRADDDGLYIPEATPVRPPGIIERGDVTKALATAPVLVEASYTTAAEHGNPLEPHATIAVWDDERLTLHDASQGPFDSASMFAGIFGLAPDAVEVIAEHVGGGFGTKAMPRTPAVLAALAAKAIGRPVKIALTRSQMYQLVPYRSPSLQKVSLAAESDGRLVAIVHEAISQASTLAEFADPIVAASRMMYAAPHVRTTTRIARLDVPPPGWLRAPGHAPGMFALESAIDELATRLKIDPIELRVRNEPVVDPELGLPFSSRSLVRCLREGARRFGWEERAPGSHRRGGRLVGTGVASSTHPVYIGPSAALARAEADGTFIVRIAATDIGTGARTVLTQVAADTLGVPLDAVRVELGRASMGPALTAGGSMGTGSWGWAVTKACQGLVAELRTHAGLVPAPGLEVRADTTDDIAAMETVSRHAFGAQFAEVEVDTDTGEIQVRRLLGVFACGRILNPTTARSQLLGAMTMGLSAALLENGEIDPEFGDFANRDLAGYHLATSADVPAIEALWLDEPDDRLGPLGGKGIGELGIVGTAAAIANAFHHATGLRVRDLPIRIEDVRPAIDRGGLR
jgi:xanthine dehydrogenase YagR molybdenum-binding subunit